MNWNCDGRFALIVYSIANAVYFCGGVAILVFGAIGLCDPATTVSLLSYIPEINTISNVLYLPGVVYGPAVYMTCAGSLAIALSFVGCLAPYKRRKSIFYVYVVGNMIFLYFNVALLIFSLIATYNNEPVVEYNMNITLMAYFDPVSFTSNGSVVLPSQVNAHAWVEMQFKQSCCGINGYQDYQNFIWNNTFPGIIRGEARVPPSCCVQKEPYSVASSTESFLDLNTCLVRAPLFADTRGCIDYVMRIIEQYNYIYGLVGAALCGVQGFILSSTTRLMILEFEKRLTVKF